MVVVSYRSSNREYTVVQYTISYQCWRNFQYYASWERSLSPIRTLSGGKQKLNFPKVRIGALWLSAGG